MQISDVRIKLVEPGPDNQRLLAYVEFMIDGCFKVRDAKLLKSRTYFVSMPNRKIEDHCPGCGHNNEIRARYCGWCGRKLAAERAEHDDNGRLKLYADVCFPIDQPTRDQLERVIVAAYQEAIRAPVSESHYNGSDNR